MGLRSRWAIPRYLRVALAVQANLLMAQTPPRRRQFGEGRVHRCGRCVLRRRVLHSASGSEGRQRALRQCCTVPNQERPRRAHGVPDEPKRRRRLVPADISAAGHAAFRRAQNVARVHTVVERVRSRQSLHNTHAQMSPVATGEDGWYLTTNGGGALHGSPLNVTLTGDPAKLVPWAASTASAATQPDNAAMIQCAQATYWTPPAWNAYGVWDNQCTQNGHVVCEYSVPHNEGDGVHMVRHAASAGMQLKESVVTRTVHSVQHRLLCLERCVRMRAACRCAAYSRSAATCQLSPFPCDRADIFTGDTVGDTAAYTRDV